MSKKEFYYEFARQQLARQDSLLADYQERAYRTITVAVALLGATAVTLTLGRGVELISLPLFLLLGALAVSFAFAMVRSVQVLAPGNWSAGVEPKEMRANLPTYEEGGLREWAGDCIVDSLAPNDGRLLVCARHLRDGLIALVFEGLLVVSVGVVVTLSSGPNVALPVSGQA